MPPLEPGAVEAGAVPLELRDGDMGAVRVEDSDADEWRVLVRATELSLVCDVAAAAFCFASSCCLFWHGVRDDSVELLAGGLRFPSKSKIHVPAVSC